MYPWAMEYFVQPTAKKYTYKMYTKNLSKKQLAQVKSNMSKNQYKMGFGTIMLTLKGVKILTDLLWPHTGLWVVFVDDVKSIKNLKIHPRHMLICRFMHTNRNLPINFIDYPSVLITFARQEDAVRFKLTYKPVHTD